MAMPKSTDTLAASAAPPNALRMWTDGVRIYVELPGSPGNDPYIVAYLYSEGGLSKALNLLGQRRADYDYLGTIPASYRKRWSGRGSAAPVGTDAQSASAEAYLRQKGIIK